MKYIKISVNDNKFHSTFRRLEDYLKNLIAATEPSFAIMTMKQSEQFNKLIMQFISNDYNFTHNYTNNDFVDASHIRVKYTNEVNQENPDEIALYIDIYTKYAHDNRVFFIE